MMATAIRMNISVSITFAASHFSRPSMCCTSAAMDPIAWVQENIARFETECTDINCPLTLRSHNYGKFEFFSVDYEPTFPIRFHDNTSESSVRLNTKNAFPDSGSTRSIEFLAR